jgi:hypothetical protein
MRENINLDKDLVKWARSVKPGLITCYNYKIMTGMGFEVTTCTTLKYRATTALSGLYSVGLIVQEDRLHICLTTRRKSARNSFHLGGHVVSLL